MRKLKNFLLGAATLVLTVGLLFAYLLRGGFQRFQVARIRFLPRRLPTGTTYWRIPVTSP
jgi:hypothetical protein